MKRLYLFFALAACLPTALFAQQTESKKRSAWHLTIPEVTVIGHRPMKEIGVQKTKFDSLALKENIALSMADILTFNSSVFVKSYGRATLSTVAFRGTSPSHTQVTWNGMRINNPMLGMTDFSTIPSYFIDQASLLHGTSSVNETGGGLGGQVKLGTTSEVAEGFNAQYVQGIGSFKTFDEFARFTYGSDRWSISTRAVYSSSPNDYKYTNHDKKIQYLRRGQEHHRTVPPRGAQPLRGVQGPAPASGSLLQYPQRRQTGAERLVYKLQPGTSDADHRLWRCDRLREPPARTDISRHPFVGSHEKQLEGRRERRLYPHVDGLRLQAGGGTRQLGVDDPLPAAR